jgi:hypothetical protein
MIDLNKKVFDDGASHTVFVWVRRILMSLIGVYVAGMGLLELMLASCHDSGGFCAGRANPDFYLNSAFYLLLSCLFFGIAFLRRFKRTMVISLSVASVFYALTFISN